MPIYKSNGGTAAFIILGDWGHTYDLTIRFRMSYYLKIIEVDAWQDL